MVHPVGTPEAIEAASSRSALMKSLERAAVNKDVVADVADACEIKEYTTMHLADPSLEPSAIANDLYLTVEEATKLKECCLQELAEIGVTLADLAAAPEEDEGAAEGEEAASVNPPAADAVEEETKADGPEAPDAEADEAQKIEPPSLTVDAQGEQCLAPLCVLLRSRIAVRRKHRGLSWLRMNPGAMDGKGHETKGYIALRECLYSKRSLRKRGLHGFGGGGGTLVVCVVGVRNTRAIHCALELHIVRLTYVSVAMLVDIFRDSCQRRDSR